MKTDTLEQIQGIISAFGYKDGVINDIGVAPQGIKEILAIAIQSPEAYHHYSEDLVVKVEDLLNQKDGWSCYQLMQVGDAIREALKEAQRCPDCGYTEADAILHADHHLCKNKNPPWGEAQSE